MARQSQKRRARPTASGVQRPRDFVRPRHSITARGSACRRGPSNSPRGFARTRQRHYHHQACSLVVRGVAGCACLPRSERFVPHRSLFFAGDSRRPEVVSAGIFEKLRAALRSTKTARPHSADQFSLTPRQQAACGSAERAHAPIASPSAHSALPSRSQKYAARYRDCARNESSSPGSEPRLRGYVVMQDASRMPHKSHYLQSRPKAVSQWEPSALGPRRLPARHATDGPVH